MAEPGSLHEAFVDELRDAYDAEKQLLKALPKLAKASTSSQLREAFETHREETQGHIDKLERVFASIDEKVRGKHCDGICGIIEEGKAIMDEDFDAQTMDACLIAAGQRSEHYEMAAYGTLVAWAKVMGHDQAAGLLEEILAEEKAADAKLTQIADGGVNKSAASSGPSSERGARVPRDSAKDAKDAKDATKKSKQSSAPQSGMAGKKSTGAKPAGGRSERRR